MTSLAVVKEQWPTCVDGFQDTTPHCTWNIWACVSRDGRWQAALMAALHVEANGVPFRYLPRKPARINSRSRTKPSPSAKEGQCCLTLNAFARSATHRWWWLNSCIRRLHSDTQRLPLRWRESGSDTPRTRSAKSCSEVLRKQRELAAHISAARKWNSWTADGPGG